MGPFYIFLVAVMLLGVPSLEAQTGYTGSIRGVVVSSGKPLPFAAIGIRGSGIGTTSDPDGKFRLSNLPLGKHTVFVTYLGYAEQEMVVEITAGDTLKTIRLEMKPSVMELGETVITGTRTEKRRLDSAVPVNVLDTRVLQATQSLNLSEGLNFQPGIRVEKDCQTCNYTQVRMNGLAGSYTQILLNSKPIFSSLTGLYGLEQIPVSMVERVEIVRGGGSVLYGSNAIAGTINIITRNPVSNAVEFNTSGALVRGESYDWQSDFMGSLLSKNKHSGAVLMVSHRDREAWDANADGFSELPDLSNLSLGLNAFLKTSKSSQLSVSLNNIHEIRNGGDNLHREPHLRLQSEFRDSRVWTGGLDYTHEFYRLRSRLDLYAGIQQTTREHYTGSYGADGYGDTDNQTLVTGIQVNHRILNFIRGANLLTIGFDYQYDDVRDAIPAYQYLIDQETFQAGAFLQSDWEWHRKFNLVSGVRFSRHNKVNHTIVSPRFNLLYKAHANLQLRMAYAEGFRAPQAFDSDMHIAFSGGGISLTEIDPGLQPESSVSYMASADYNKPAKNYIYGFTLTGFYTQLERTFILVTLPGTNNLFRTNGSDASVSGLTAEARANFNYRIEADIGFTIQQSSFTSAFRYTETTQPVKRFLRTPDHYGYFAVNASPVKPFKVTVSGNYTGAMTLLHLAGAPGVSGDTLVRSRSFMEWNTKAEYRLGRLVKGMEMYLHIGVQNITNAFQTDFDRGPNRDSNYVYGPGRPRTWYAGIRVAPIRPR